MSMSAKTLPHDTEQKEGEIVAYELTDGQEILKGSPVFLDATTKLAFTNDWTTKAITAGDVFVGIAVESVDTTEDDTHVRVYRKGTHLMKGTSVATTTLGKKAYINNTVDNDEVAFAATTSGQPQVIIGAVVEIESATQARVAIDNFVDTVVANA